MQLTLYRNRFVLEDVNLEARDCLTLWKHMSKTFPPALLRETTELDPTKSLPEMTEKSHIIEWEKNLKILLKKAMEMHNSPFRNLQASLGTIKNSEHLTITLDRHFTKLFPLVCELHAQDALPAIVFNYDRFECEQATKHILLQPQVAEDAFKRNDEAWQQRYQAFEQWKRENENGRARGRPKVVEEGVSKLDLAREDASVEISVWESFNPNTPLKQFSFAGTKTMQQKDFDDLVNSLSKDKVAGWLIEALRRGLGVHHAGMNRRYRQV
jgi:superfamily II RNA helicase